MCRTLTRAYTGTKPAAPYIQPTPYSAPQLPLVSRLVRALCQIRHSLLQNTSHTSGSCSSSKICGVPVVLLCLLMRIIHMLLLCFCAIVSEEVVVHGEGWLRFASWSAAQRTRPKSSWPWHALCNFIAGFLSMIRQVH